MTRESAPKGALQITAGKRDQSILYPLLEVECRLDAAAGLLAAAQFGWLDRNLAERGAIALLDGARRHLLAVA